MLFRSFDTKPAAETIERQEVAGENDDPATDVRRGAVSHSLGGLHYNIQIILPESRDPKVYDALFRSLREHLL